MSGNHHPGRQGFKVWPQAASYGPKAALQEALHVASFSNTAEFVAPLQRAVNTVGITSSLRRAGALIVPALFYFNFFLFMNKSSDTAEDKPILSSNVMNPVRLECILDTLNALLPKDVDGNTTYGFVLAIVEAGNDSSTLGVFSNMDSKGKQTVLSVALQGVGKETKKSKTA